MNRQGYILLETVVALTLLSVAAYTVHGTIRQALLARGQAQDYAQVRLLLEGVVADAQLQPLVVEGQRSGRFLAPHNRFSWTYSIRKIDLPMPPPPPMELMQERGDQEFEYSRPHLAHIHATVRWSRGGIDHEESFETLFSPMKLWLPKEER